MVLPPLLQVPGFYICRMCKTAANEKVESPYSRRDDDNPAWSPPEADEDPESQQSPLESPLLPPKLPRRASPEGKYRKATVYLKRPVTAFLVRFSRFYFSEKSMPGAEALLRAIAVLEAQPPTSHDPAAEGPHEPRSPRNEPTANQRALPDT